MQNLHDETVWGIMLALAGFVAVMAALFLIWRKRRCTFRVEATLVDVTGEKDPTRSRHPKKSAGAGLHSPAEGQGASSPLWGQGAKPPKSANR